MLASRPELLPTHDTGPTTTSNVSQSISSYAPLTRLYGNSRLLASFLFF